MKKPGRHPTPEQIAAFEETGRAKHILDPSLLTTETQKSLSLEANLVSGDAAPREPGRQDTRKSANPQTQKDTSTEIRIPVKPEIQEHGSLPSQEPARTDSRIAVNTEPRISGPVVRLTIDLPESAHTRFKTACAMTKRKMVDEVRAFIEQRTAELEGEAGRAL